MQVANTDIILINHVVRAEKDLVAIILHIMYWEQTLLWLCIVLSATGCLHYASD